MFDARYFAYATISGVLVISPGATMAVVMETAIGEGRLAALYTVIGVNIGNSSLALASALGMSIVFHEWPGALQAVKVAGAAYLAYLGARGLYYALKGRAAPQPAQSTRFVQPVQSVQSIRSNQQINRSRNQQMIRGVLTNLLNPPVILFYMTFLPQFIGPDDPFFARFLVLAATHVSMSIVWLSFYAFALGILAERFARPAVRRTLEGLTGTLLLGFGARLLLR